MDARKEKITITISNESGIIYNHEIQVGTRLVFGNRKTYISFPDKIKLKPHIWSVVEIKGSLLYLYADSIISSRCYHYCYGGDGSWKDCTLRERDAEEFFQEDFTDLEKSCMEKIKTKYTEDYVTIPSVEEFVSYFPNKEDWKCIDWDTGERKDCEYWLRNDEAKVSANAENSTIDKDDCYYVNSASGSIGTTYHVPMMSWSSGASGFRPLICVNLEKMQSARIIGMLPKT